jgi:hypothetical protein
VHQLKLLIDPPSGWLYKFPAPWDGTSDLATLLREHNYPEKDIEFALQNMRIIRQDEATSD